MNKGLLQNLTPRLTIVGFGLIAGLVSSLAISGLILMVEKVTAVPLGTFYMVLMAAITDSQVNSVNMIAIGLLLHLISGSIIGIIHGPTLCIPENISIRTHLWIGIRISSMVHNVPSYYILVGSSFD
jgi:hypothetical protein